MISILGVLRVLIYVIILAVLYLVFMKPQLLANIIIRNYPKNITVTLDKNYTTEYFRGFEVYHLNDTVYKPKTPVVVFITGGLFIMSNPEMALMQRLNRDCRIVTFNHPVRFKVDTNDIITFIYDLIKEHVFKRYKGVHKEGIIIMGHSAGSFYGAILTQLIRSNTNIPVHRFIAVNGFFGSTTTNVLLFKLMSLYYIERGLLYKLPERVPADEVVIISTRLDFLRESSEVYAAKNLVKLQLFDGDHHSVYKINRHESKSIIDFINTKLV